MDLAKYVIAVLTVFPDPDGRKPLKRLAKSEGLLDHRAEATV